MKTSSGNGRRLEHLLAARIFITIQIRIHRSSHTGIVVGVPNHFQRIGDRNLAISLQQGILIRRGDDPALNGFLRILKGQVRLDIADTHRQTQFERTGKFQPFGKIPAINGINLHQRFAVGRCSKKIFQNGNRIIERLEKMVVKYILSEPPRNGVQAGDHTYRWPGEESQPSEYLRQPSPRRQPIPDRRPL